jgi:hypothetical protein
MRKTTGPNKLTYVRFAVLMADTAILNPEDAGGRFLQNVEFIPEFTLHRVITFKPRDVR